MQDFSRQEAAERAGVDVGELGRMVELGFIHPGADDRFSSGEIRKAGLVHSLVESGLPLEGMAAVIAGGGMSLDFMDFPAYARFTSLSDVTFAQLSERTGVPVELLMVIREATGGAQPDPNDRLTESELDMVPFVELPFRDGFRPIAIERMLRVQGDSLRRIAEQESDMWRSEVIVPRLAQGITMDAIAADEVADRLAPRIDPALVANYHSHQVREWTRNIIDGIELILAQSGYQSRLEHPPAMCFLDITGYTRLTDERGDEAAAALAAELGRLVQRSSVQHGGKAVKWLGDGVMFWFRDPGAGVVAALDMADGVRGAGLPPAHVGLHAGPVVFQQGDYYGQTVNIASRIAEYARPGEVLVSQAVVEASEGAGAAFTEIGPVELKGVGGTVHLHAARRG
ncbi:MAG: adenylate/guanylate cyclase domain-containing protein [Candidatus Limnocylindria bacterium]